MGSGSAEKPRSCGGLRNRNAGDWRIRSGRSEGRASGNYTIVISVTNPVTSGSANVTAGSGKVSAVSFSGNDMIVSLTGVANQQVLTLTASGVTDINGNVLDPISIPVGFLRGDTNG